MHIYINKLGHQSSDNGLSPFRYQAIIGTTPFLLLIWYFSDVSIKVDNFLSRKLNEMSPEKMAAIFLRLYHDKNYLRPQEGCTLPKWVLVFTNDPRTTIYKHFTPLSTHFVSIKCYVMSWYYSNGVIIDKEYEPSTIALTVVVSAQLPLLMQNYDQIW